LQVLVCCFFFHLDTRSWQTQSSEVCIFSLFHGKASVVFQQTPRTHSATSDEGLGKEIQKIISRETGKLAKCCMYAQLSVMRICSILLVDSTLTYPRCFNAVRWVSKGILSAELYSSITLLQRLHICVTCDKHGKDAG